MEEPMNQEAEIIYVSPERLQELSDKRTFEEYQRKEARERGSAPIKHLGLYRIQKLANLEVDNLPEREKEVIKLYFWESLSFKEIANKLNSSSRKIERIYNKAINLLKNRIIKALNHNQRFSLEDSLCGKL